MNPMNWNFVWSFSEQIGFEIFPIFLLNLSNRFYDFLNLPILRTNKAIKFNLAPLDKTFPTLSFKKDINVIWSLISDLWFLKVLIEDKRKKTLSNYRSTVIFFQWKLMKKCYSITFSLGLKFFSSFVDRKLPKS